MAPHPERVERLKLAQIRLINAAFTMRSLGALLHARTALDLHNQRNLLLRIAFFTVGS